MSRYGKLFCGSVATYSLSLLPLWADNSSTNELSATCPPQFLEFDDGLTSKDWGTRFGRELLKNQNIIFDRLGPLTGYQFTRDAQSRKYGIYEEIGAMGRGAFERALENSAQETALALLPIDEWMEVLPLEKWAGFGARLVKGSLGNTAEQELGDVSASYSATESWWREAGRDGTLRYGIRPRTAPYLYASSNIGHVEGRPALALEGRVRYLPFDRFQTSLTAIVALPNSCELSLSALCEPLQFSHTTSAAARIQRVVGSGPSASVVFLGVLHNSSETSVFFGFSRPW